MARAKSKFTKKKKSKKPIFDVSKRKTEEYIESQRAEIIEDLEDLIIGPCYDEDRDKPVFSNFQNDGKSEEIDKFLQACPHLDVVRALSLLEDYPLKVAIKKGKSMIMAPKGYVATWIHMDLENPADQDWKEADARENAKNKEKRRLGDDYEPPAVVKLKEIVKMYLDAQDANKVEQSYIKTVWPAVVPTKESRIAEIKLSRMSKKAKAKLKAVQKLDEPTVIPKVEPAKATSKILKAKNVVKKLVKKGIETVNGKVIKKIKKKLDTKKVVKFVLKSKPSTSKPAAQVKTLKSKPPPMKKKAKAIVLKAQQIVKKAKAKLKKAKDAKRAKLVSKNVLKHIKQSKDDKKKFSGSSQPNTSNGSDFSAKPPKSKPSSKSTTKKITKKKTSSTQAPISSIAKQRISPGKENKSKPKKVETQKNMKVINNEVKKKVLNGSK